MIETLQYSPNEKILEEIDAIEKSRRELLKKVEETKTLTDYCTPFLSSTGGQEFLAKLGSLPSMKILDIGFGRGETSLYLASQGHEVHALEPSPLQCEILQRACEKYGHHVRIYQGTIESFSQIGEEEFDLCLFNSSLHHCDEPVQALQICKSKLKNKGTVFAINEPILKFYHSKKWFYKQLIEDPVSVGHYGGNEHIYYYHEYLSLFRLAGFSSVLSSLHIRNRSPRLVLFEDLQRKIGDHYIHSDVKLLIKFTILLLLKNFWSGPLLALGKKLSLFPFSFEARVGKEPL